MEHSYRRALGSSSRGFLRSRIISWVENSGAARASHGSGKSRDSNSTLPSEPEYLLKDDKFKAHRKSSRTGRRYLAARTPSQAGIPSSGHLQAITRTSTNPWISEHLPERQERLLKVPRLSPWNMKSHPDEYQPSSETVRNTSSKPARFVPCDSTSALEEPT